MTKKTAIHSGKLKGTKEKSCELKLLNGTSDKIDYRKVVKK